MSSFVSSLQFLFVSLFGFRRSLIVSFSLLFVTSIFISFCSVKMSIIKEIYSVLLFCIILFIQFSPRMSEMRNSVFSASLFRAQIAQASLSSTGQYKRGEQPAESRHWHKSC
ncbi:Hypothetical_protein [Hexamita inflata]|uniref:Hypothetical_protein n=1 Tax=Hexamita inflata TaxID=28002 RepID=A0AA86RG24_9EUKA|nr:Hypothetical protein HINF_LOCUS63462 [Hexamita inflata]